MLLLKHVRSLKYQSLITWWIFFFISFPLSKPSFLERLLAFSVGANGEGLDKNIYYYLYMDFMWRFPLLDKFLKLQ